ncbi:MAG: hypothetical protein II497_06555, partial [Lachnospiraceae bacterium]|nr:hypothetical protein [Lachnospiraceae bacterium]
HGFRPVYTLRQDIRVISGEGTADNPYDLGVYYDDEIIRLYGIYERTIKFHSGINDEVITETQYYNPYSVFYTSDVEAPKPSLSGLEEYNWQGLGYRGDTNAEPEDYTISEGVIIENPDETFDTSLGDYTTDDDITSVTGTSGDTGPYIR